MRTETEHLPLAEPAPRNCGRPDHDAPGRAVPGDFGFIAGQDFVIGNVRIVGRSKQRALAVEDLQAVVLLAEERLPGVGQSDVHRARAARPVFAIQDPRIENVQRPVVVRRSDVGTGADPDESAPFADESTDRLPTFFGKAPPLFAAAAARVNQQVEALQRAGADFPGRHLPVIDPVHLPQCPGEVRATATRADIVVDSDMRLSDRGIRLSCGNAEGRNDRGCDEAEAHPPIQHPFARLAIPGNRFVDACIFRDERGCVPPSGCRGLGMERSRCAAGLLRLVFDTTALHPSLPCRCSSWPATRPAGVERTHEQQSQQLHRCSVGCVSRKTEQSRGSR